MQKNSQATLSFARMPHSVSEHPLPSIIDIPRKQVPAWVAEVRKFRFLPHSLIGLGAEHEIYSKPMDFSRSERKGSRPPRGQGFASGTRVNNHAAVAQKTKGTDGFSCGYLPPGLMNRLLDWCFSSGTRFVSRMKTGQESNKSTSDLDVRILVNNYGSHAYTARI